MHALHLRLPKNFVLEERLDRYASAIETSPSSYAGRWAEACAPLAPGTPKSFREVRLDLGCGKGAFLVEAARREPDVLFIGIDGEPICIAYAAELISQERLPNAIVVPGIAEKLSTYFIPGELTRIYINFPTPCPKRRHATLRLTHAAQLTVLWHVLSPQGQLICKTDSKPLFSYSLTQLPLAGFDIQWTSTDTRTEHPDDPETGYERRLTAQGARVLGICATPGALPLSDPELEEAEAAIPQSLVEYLPTDLQDMDYIPHGMEATVVNLANRQAKQHKIHPVL